jgi:hypothetical protein
MDRHSMISVKSEKSRSQLPAYLYAPTANDRRNVTALRSIKTTPARSEILKLTAGGFGSVHAANDQPDARKTAPEP